MSAHAYANDRHSFIRARQAEQRAQPKVRKQRRERRSDVRANHSHNDFGLPGTSR